MSGYLVDGMLGKLAKWLRILGLDVRYARGEADEILVLEALASGRILVTRDRRLAERKAIRGRCILIHSEQWREQLHEFFKHTGTPPPDCLLRRCTVCNEPLASISPTGAAPHIPAVVAHKHQAFLYCSACNRVYWAGSHRDRIISTLAELGLSGGLFPTPVTQPAKTETR